VGIRSEANLKYLEKKKIEGFHCNRQWKMLICDRHSSRPAGTCYAQGATRWTACDGNCRTKVAAAIGPANQA